MPTAYTSTSLTSLDLSSLVKLWRKHSCNGVIMRLLLHLSENMQPRPDRFVDFCHPLSVYEQVSK